MLRGDGGKNDRRQEAREDRQEQDGTAYVGNEGEHLP